MGTCVTTGERTDRGRQLEGARVATQGGAEDTVTLGPVLGCENRVTKQKPALM